VTRGEGCNHFIVEADTQSRFNTQFNLFKFKRLKMFRLLLQAEPALHTLDLAGIVGATRKHHRRLALYGADEGSLDLAACPHCGAIDLSPLPGRASQPLIGFVSPEIPLYQRCRHLGLGFMTPHARPARAPADDRPSRRRDRRGKSACSARRRFVKLAL
jgi:hypothetical protein